MMFWVIIALVSVVCVLVVIYPMINGSGMPAKTSRGMLDRAVYRDQLQEIERDLDSGALDARQAENARLEVARRLLMADRADDRAVTIEQAPHGKAGTATLVCVLVIALLVPVGALALYVLEFGTPGEPDMPYRMRIDSARRDAALDARMTQERIDAMRQRVSQNPSDAAAWLTLADLLLKQGKGDEAVRDAQKGASLLPNDVQAQGTYARIRVVAGKGQIDEETHDVLMHVLALDRQEGVARFLLGQERRQNRDMEGALAIWLDLKRQTTPTDSWATILDEETARLVNDTGIDASKVAPRHPLDFAPQSWKDIRGRVRKDSSDSAPGSSTGSSAPVMGSTVGGTFTPEEKAAFGAMITSLKQKVEEQPGDFPTWMMLARTQRMTGDFDDAIQAYKKALSIKENDMEARRGLAIALAVRTRSQGSENYPKELYDILRTVLRDNPQDNEALYYLGVEAAQLNQKAQARDYWSRLLVLLPAQSDMRPLVQSHLDQLGAP